jgi:hypothetical protein
VWLDVAKDCQQHAILTALEQLIQQGDIRLILPRIVVDEFARNKARIIEESSRSLSSTLKRAKEAVEKFGDPRKKHLPSRKHLLHFLDSEGACVFLLGCGIPDYEFFLQFDQKAMPTPSRVPDCCCSRFCSAWLWPRKNSRSCFILVNAQSAQGLRRRSLLARPSPPGSCRPVVLDHSQTLTLHPEWN